MNQEVHCLAYSEPWGRPILPCDWMERPADMEESEEWLYTGTRWLHVSALSSLSGPVERNTIVQVVPERRLPSREVLAYDVSRLGMERAARRNRLTVKEVRKLLWGNES